MEDTYAEPYYYSEFFGKEMEVETVIDMLNTMTKKDACDALMLELHMHLLDYECPKLKKVLKALDARAGHKPYSKPPTLPNKLQPGAELRRGIFKTEAYDRYKKEYCELDMRLLQQWIRQNFLPHCEKKYSWLALWCFFRDKDILENDSIKDFCEQMGKWLFDPQSSDPHRPVAKDAYAYTGYLTENAFELWTREEFMKQKKDRQSEAGYDHLHAVYLGLNGRWVVSRLKPHFQTDSL